MHTSAITSPGVVPPPSQPDRTATVAREFEALFSAMMLRAMRKTVMEEGSLIPRSMGENIYTGMLDDEYARLLGADGSLGLAKLVEQELRQNSGATDATHELATPAWMHDRRFVSSGTSSSPPVRSPENYRNLAGRLDRWDTLISAAADANGVDRNLVRAVVAQESGGNQYAVSRAGAKGLMQLMDGTARELGVSSSFDPKQNIDGGVRYLRMMLDRFGGNERHALAAYNAGPGAVDRYNGIPPFRETQDYVRSVRALRAGFDERAYNGE